MPIFISNYGNQFSLPSQPIGQGGEGAVYSVDGNNTIVAKIFHPDKRTNSREKKIFTMIQSGLPEAALKQIAWPIELLYQNNKFCGYIMPKLRATVDLNKVYEVGTEYSHLNYLDRIIIAQNLCRAVEQIHKCGQVIGDLNPSNVQVIVQGPHRNGITLVDTDSYHIKDSKAGLIYKCLVANPFFTAPEIQIRMKDGTTYSDLKLPTFTQNSDNFALAVLIFSLLMNGSHPFSKRVKDNIQYDGIIPDINHEIRRQNTVYFIQDKVFDIPIYSPELNSITPELQALFRRAFIGPALNRPTAREWLIALMNFRQNLVQCKHKIGHVYYGNLRQCPWCKLEKNLNQQLFEKSVISNLTMNKPYQSDKKKTLPKRSPYQKPVMINQNLNLKQPSVQSVNNLQVSLNRELKPVDVGMKTIDNPSSFKPIGSVYIFSSLIIAFLIGAYISIILFGSAQIFLNDWSIYYWTLTATVSMIVNFLFNIFFFSVIRTKSLWFLTGELVSFCTTLLFVIFFL